MEKLVTSKKIELPKYEPQKLDLPRKSNFVGAISWLNGVVVLGNRISPYYVNNRNGLDFTNFNRTL